MKNILSFPPLSLFFILVSVTFFFGVGKTNGAFHLIVSSIFDRAKISRPWLPPALFFLTAFLAMAGPGNIVVVALTAPFAMALADKRRIDPLMTAIAVVFGANAGAFSPLAPTGIIAHNIVESTGYALDEWRQLFWPAFVVQAATALICYAVWFWLGGRNNVDVEESSPTSVDRTRIEPRQRWTFAAILLYLIGSIFLGWEPSFLAAGLSAVLMTLGCAKFSEVLRTVPWKVILLICGIGSLVHWAEHGGLLAWIATRLAMASNASYAAGYLALVAGCLSSFSSSSGVVMPAMLPMIPNYMGHLGLNNAMALVASVNIGSHLVDASPVSTLGALCLANGPSGPERTRFFRRLLLFGLSMSFLGALCCHVAFDRLRIWP